MKLKHLFLAAPAALLVLGSGAANAGNTIDKVGAIVCVADKWNEKEPEKGHKLVDYAGRCVNIPDEPAATPMATDDCVGNYEYMPDGSWRARGPVTSPLKEATSYPRAGRRVRTSSNTCSRLPAAPASTRAPAVAARTFMKA